MTTIDRLGVVLERAAPLLTLRRGADNMGMAAPTYWTAEMVRQLPDDGNRYEVVYGELLVTPAPRLSHQLLVSRLTVAVARYLELEPLGIVLTSPADISWGLRDVLVQPDVFIIPPDEARTGDWTRLRSLPLVIEVLSPSTARADRFTKRRRYQEAGVPVYWIVDGDEQRVEVWTPDAELPTIESLRLVWHPAGAGQPFTLALAELFRAV
jgi:Uma2 family endonuclease